MNRSEPLTDLSKLLTEARSLPLARPTIAALAQAHPIELMKEGLARAVGDGDVPAATALAFAIGTAGGRIAQELAIQLIPDLESIEYFPIIAGITDGDRLTMLLDLVEGGRLSWEREALALYLVTQLLDGAEPPARLVTALRALAREPTEPGAALLVAAAAKALGNQHLISLVSGMIPAAAIAERRGVHKMMIAGFFAPVLDSLPAEAARVIGSGYTVVRPEPKTGRNDPCPCGSGKKFKKCHGDQPEAPGRHALVDQFQKLGTRGGKIQDQVFENLRPGELARLNPEELTTRQLVGGSRRLGWHRRWEDAERFMDALATRTDLRKGITGNDFRIELADEALEAGNLDLAERQFARATVSEERATGFRLTLALARKAPDALEQLESAAAKAHSTGDPTLLHDCAFGLLRHSPALGILVARGCMDRERLLDSETLLKDIEGARDRLGLPPTEPWWEIFDLLLNEGLEPEAAQTNTHDAENRRQREIDQMRADLLAAQSRASRLDKELANRVEQLESLTGEREQLAAIVQATGGGEYQKRVSSLEEEKQRLRAKISELKGEITEGSTQRAALRRELAETADALRREHRPSNPEEDAEEQDGVDQAEGESAATRPRKILVPQYTPAASRSLNEAPVRVATDALRLTALLAAGDAHAWSGVKHMHGVHDILSIRIGRAYRILFRVGDERLEILDLILRRDLDEALQRQAGR